MKKDKKVNTNIPILFQKLKTYEIEDIRFTKVKIWLMHLGENFNGSYFDKEVVEDAIPTLANTPILAYIENSDSEDKDYSDHREELVKENGEYKIKYKGQAIGVIPETNEAQFEIRLCDDGIEREFLTVQGLLWNKFEDSIEIMNRDKKKSESMELAKDYEGEFQEDDLFHFTKFKFYGACGLGEGIEPAMINASIELDFSLNDFTKEIQVKMEQFKKYIQNQSSNGVGDIDNKNQEGGNKMAKGNKNFSLSNEQLADAIRQVLCTKTEIKNDYWGEPYETSLYYYIDAKDGFAIVISNDWSNLYGIPYTVSGDTVTLDFDNKVPYIQDYRPKQESDVVTLDFVKNIINEEVKYTAEKSNTKLTSEFDNKVKEYETKIADYAKESETNKSKISEFEIKEKELNTQVTDLNSKFEKLETEAKELREFKSTKITDERKTKENAIFETYKDLDGVAEYEAIKKDTSKFEKVEDMEKEIALLFVKNKVTFSKNGGSIKIPIGKKEEKTSVYGDLFEKYSNK